MKIVFYILGIAFLSLHCSANGLTCEAVFHPPTLEASHAINSHIARTIVRNNGDGPGFETRRGLSFYIKMMPQKYEDALNLLFMKGGRYLDSGSGEGLALSQVKSFDFDNRIEAIGVTAKMETNPKEIEKPGLRIFADGRFLEEIPNQDLGKFDLIVDNYGPYAYSADPLSVFIKYLQLTQTGGSIFIQTGHRDRQLVEVPGHELTAHIPLEYYLRLVLQPLIQNKTLVIETLPSKGMTLGQKEYEPYRVLSIQVLQEIDWGLVTSLKTLKLKDIHPGNPPNKILTEY